MENSVWRVIFMGQVNHGNLLLLYAWLLRGGLVLVRLHVLPVPFSVRLSRWADNSKTKGLEKQKCVWAFCCEV